MKEEILQITNKYDLVKIIKYIFSSGSSFFIDILLFTIFNYFFNNILISTIIARIISSLYNYFINSRLVFKNYTKSSIIKYYCLVIIQMFVSALSVWIINIVTNIDATIIKIPVDIMIFVINYVIQKNFIFKK